MIIDFHTHIFPDRIASSTVHHLACEARIHPYTDGSADALVSSMAASSVDWSVNLPVMTSGSQVEKVNASLLKKRDLFQDQHILSFGGLHPDCRNYRQVLRWLREEGVAGIKLHPAYMGIDLNDLRMMKLIEAISEEGLITIIHAGIDIGIYDHNYASVDHVLQIMKDVAPERFVLAHMGNWGCWDQVESDLAGAPLWMDTSFSLGPVTPYEKIKDQPIVSEMLSAQDFVRICRKHGPDRILFATDSPWADQDSYVKKIQSLPFTEEEKASILGDNAEKLLQGTAAGRLPLI